MAHRGTYHQRFAQGLQDESDASASAAQKLLSGMDTQDSCKIPMATVHSNMVNFKLVLSWIIIDITINDLCSSIKFHESSDKKYKQ